MSISAPGPLGFRRQACRRRLRTSPGSAADLVIEVPGQMAGCIHAQSARGKQALHPGNPIWISGERFTVRAISL
jgi:hypothetical protein